MRITAIDPLAVTRTARNTRLHHVVANTRTVLDYCGRDDVAVEPLRSES